MRLRSLHKAYPSPHPFGVVHWVPEQLNIKAVTGACKLIDGYITLHLFRTILDSISNYLKLIKTGIFCRTLPA